VILSSLIQGYRGNLMGVVGDILAIDATDLIAVLVLMGGSIFFY